MATKKEEPGKKTTKTSPKNQKKSSAKPPVKKTAGEEKTNKRSTAKKSPAKNKTAKQSVEKKTPAKKPAAKKPVPKTTAAKQPPVQVQSGRPTIADRKVAWNQRDKLSLLRWILMVPLVLLGIFCSFIIAGYSFTGLVCFVLVGIFLFYNLAAILGKTYPEPVKVVKRIVTVILCIGILIVGVTEAIIIKHSFGDSHESCDYVVVLGAKVRNDGPSVSLQNRIDAAYDYLTTHPDTVAILSGGMGADEPITEAKCMFDALVAMGIDESRLWMEDKATSTWENLRFSLDLIEARTGQRPATIGIISSEYHLFRAGLFADACGVESVGIPARTTRISQMINHFMREVAGVWHYILLGGQYND